MKHKPFDPLRLDVSAFATESAQLEGRWPLAALPRLAEATVPVPEGEGAEDIAWQARGETGERRGGAPSLWLHLEAGSHVWLQCQRCLQPMRETLALERAFRFVRSEAEAEAEDPDSEEDVLALGRPLDLRVLAEDELILALPLVPRHEVCPDPLPLPQEMPDVRDALEAQEEATAPHPFAKLAALKRGKSSH